MKNYTTNISVTTIPRFRGWSAEDSMAIKEWSNENRRIIHLLPGHKNIKSEYVTEIVGKMEMESGAQEDYEQLHVYLAAI
jgi:hypothetical protein